MQNEVQRHQLSQPNEQDDSIIGVCSTVVKHDSIIMGIYVHTVVKYIMSDLLSPVHKSSQCFTLKI